MRRSDLLILCVALAALSLAALGFAAGYRLAPTETRVVILETPCVLLRNWDTHE